MPFGVARRLFEPIVRERPDLLGAGLAAVAGPVFDGRLRDAADAAATLTNGLITLLHAALAGSPAGEAPSPLLLVVDDLQWVDGTSLLFLAELAGRIEEVGVGVALGIRSGDPSVDPGLVHRIRGAPQARILEPPALTDGAIASIVERELGDGSDASVRLVAHATAGNPLLVTELVATVRSGGHGLQDEQDLNVALGAVVPAAVARFTLVRLEALGPQANALARAAALLSEAPLQLVAQLAGLGIEEAEAAADALAARRILAAGEPVRFEHPLIAAAVASLLTPFKRSGMHRRAAELLDVAGQDADVVAVHLLEARAQGDAWTTGVLRRAAVSALARGEPAVAAGLLARALAEPPPPGERGDVMVELARAQAAAGDRGAIERFQAALEHVHDGDVRVDAWHNLSRLLSLCGDFEGAVGAACRGRAELPDDDPRAERLLADELAAVVLLPERSAELQERTRAMVQATRAGAPPRAPGLLAHLVLQLGWRGEDLDLIPGLARRAVAAGPLVVPDTRGVGVMHVAGALTWIDDLSGAAGLLDAAIARAGELGDALTQLALRTSRAWAHYYAGELTLAQRQLDLVIGAASGWDAHLGLAGGPLAMVALERDDLVAARAGAALAALAPAPFGYIGGCVTLAAGNASAALDAITAAGEQLQSLGMGNPTAVPWRSWAALAARRLGQEERARALADTELARARELGVARGLGVALRVAALCSVPVPSLELLEQSVVVLEASPSRLELVRSLVDLGAAQRRARQTLDARATLARALELADEMGALALARQARLELRAAGARPRRAARTGAGALTAGELRVAELAAGGISTREIAVQLVLSPRTVDGHLAAVYRKLGIGSRRELATKLVVDGT